MCLLATWLGILVFCCVELSLGSDIGRLKNVAALKKLMYKEQIIPDLIDDVPEHAVTVRYHSKSVSFGNKLTLYDIVQKPIVVNYPLKKGELYTLIMTGLDVSSRVQPDLREYIHWLVINIPDRNLRKGEHLPSYNGAIYHYQTGIHRVVFLVYHQNQTLQIAGEHHQKDFMKVKRENFSTRSFVKKYNLGKPFAINWAEIDEECELPSPPVPGEEPKPDSSEEEQTKDPLDEDDDDEGYDEEEEERKRKQRAREEAKQKAIEKEKEVEREKQREKELQAEPPKDLDYFFGKIADEKGSKKSNNTKKAKK